MTRAALAAEIQADVAAALQPGEPTSSVELYLQYGRSTITLGAFVAAAVLAGYIAARSDDGSTLLSARLR